MQQSARLVCELAAIACLAALWHWLLPLFPGVTLSASLWVAVVVAATYRFYEARTIRGIAVLPVLVSVWLLMGAKLLSGGSPGRQANTQIAKPSAEAKRTPYAVVLLVHALLRMGVGIVFLTIMWALLPRFFSANSAVAVMLSGAALALASWFSPLALFAVIVVVGLIVAVSSFLGLFLLGKLTGKAAKSGKTQERVALKLGQTLGMSFGLLLLPITEILRTFPANPADRPPEEVPEGLSAQQYYELGVKYKDVGWIQQSRVALRRAVALDQDGATGIKAERYMRTKLPRTNVPEEAVQRNIVGYNQMMSGDTKAAKQTFEHLIEEYPEFEWPFSNLASIHVNEKNVAKARELTEKALQLNPDYLNGHLRMADVCKLEQNAAGRRASLEKAKQLDPEDQLISLLLKSEE